MDGQPVWLASLSRWRNRNRPRSIETGSWTRQAIKDGEQILRRVLDGVGDTSRERLFRMNVTLCMHRALTDAEAQSLRGFGTCQPTHLAGGPIEVLWESQPGGLSTKPCATPRRKRIGETWLPMDCGECPSCRARRVYEQVAS